MDKMKFETPDMTAGNIDKIAALFPNCITESSDGRGGVRRAVNFDMLRQMLSDEVVEGDEAYEFTWVGKKAAVVEANKPIRKTLRPCPEESVDWDNTENLYIEGDNLEVLKLLQESYLGKVKMIYIDPPYNTGHDFVYPDSFIMDNEEYNEGTGYFDEDGNVNYHRENSASAGKYHSDWCSMIYSRLMLARNLLTDDGVIFISIDENEVDNLRKICNEVMGINNFLAQIITISNPGGRDYKQVALMHEYVLIYGKSDSTELYEIEKECSFEKFDANGGYELRELRNRNPKFHRGNRPNLFFPIFVNPDDKDQYDCCAVSLTQDENYRIEVCPYNSSGNESVWRWGKQKVLSNICNMIDKSNVVAKQKKDGNYNIYEKCRKATSKVKSLWNETEMRTEDGTRLVRSLFGNTFFDHPKPIALLKKCLYLSTNEDSIILDFFSGSATTAHAVMQLNAEELAKISIGGGVAT